MRAYVIKNGELYVGWHGSYDVIERAKVFYDSEDAVDALELDGEKVRAVEVTIEEA